VNVVEDALQMLPLAGRCQAVIEKPGKYVVKIPKWNRNYVVEGKPAHGPGS
jgi:hypothetical protein